MAMPRVKPGVKYGAIIFPLYTNSNIRIRSLSITKKDKKSVRKDIPVYYFEIENIPSIHKTKRRIKQNKTKKRKVEGYFFRTQKYEIPFTPPDVR